MSKKKVYSAVIKYSFLYMSVDQVCKPIQIFCVFTDFCSFILCYQEKYGKKVSHYDHGFLLAVLFSFFFVFFFLMAIGPLQTFDLSRDFMEVFPGLDSDPR